MRFVPPCVPGTDPRTVSGLFQICRASPDRASFLEKPYARGLSLLSIGQPFVSAGGSAFGSFIRAGVSFGLGDMLGDQELDTAVQVGKDAMDFAFQTMYLNRRSRWTWGVVGGQIPTATGVSKRLWRW